MSVWTERWTDARICCKTNLCTLVKGKKNTGKHLEQKHTKPHTHLDESYSPGEFRWHAPTGQWSLFCFNTSPCGGSKRASQPVCPQQGGVRQGEEMVETKARLENRGRGTSWGTVRNRSGKNKGVVVEEREVRERG